MYIYLLFFEPPSNRPPLRLVREGYTLTWSKNETIAIFFYWASRNEIIEHIFRKRYTADKYDTNIIIPGEPRATEYYTVEELIYRGILGIYAWRRNENR